MHDDSFPAAEKILTDIENIFKRDKDLRDFEILPVPVGENKSPVLHAEYTLGLEEWCVRHLYLHVYHKVMNLKQHQRLRREDPNVLSRLLLGGVLLNPDCSLLWNMRRELVVMGRFDPLSELHINAVTLSRRPKTSEAFVYRRWILNQIKAKAERLDVVSSPQLLEEELRVTLMAADRYANNYHAWNHRMWVMSHLPQAQDYLTNEWITSENWVSRHVSEHSGLQYREFLFNQLVKKNLHSDLCTKLHGAVGEFFLPLKDSCLNGVAFKDTRHSRELYSSLLNILENREIYSSCPINCGKNPIVVQIGLLAFELCFVTELIRLYPGHEALWCHRRFIVFSFYSLAKKLFSNMSEESDITDGIPLPKAQKLSVLDSDFKDGFLWQVVFWHEDALFKESSSSPPDECYQSKLAHRHHKWIKEILSCNRVGFETPGTS